MAARVWLAPASTLEYPDGGGHLWAFLNWALGLRSAGAEVVWLEGVAVRRGRERAADLLERLKRRLAPYGLDTVALFEWDDAPLPDALTEASLTLDAVEPDDVLVNLQYFLPAPVVARFRRRALVDIDPGLLQTWLAAGRLPLAEHDVYFTTGETVGRSDRIPTCGLPWRYTAPPVALEEWGDAPSPPADGAYTTVSNWWGEYEVIDGETVENAKRVGFRRYADLPRRAGVPLELALTLSDGDDEERRRLEGHGWRVRHAYDVTATPDGYRAYVHASRGEFSAAKPSCLRLANAWISDRTVCYLASGRPAVVEHTGASAILPEAEGLFRVHGVDDAARALTAVERDYERHAAAARALAEERFDARAVGKRVLEAAL